MFRVRSAEEPKIFVSKYQSGELLKESVSEGDSVDLRMGDERVLVKDVKVIKPGMYQGVIYGFEPSFGTEYEGLSINQQIEFSEEHIFGCVVP